MTSTPHGGSANRSASDNECPFTDKMIGPHLPARVEQRNHLTAVWINTSQIRSLMDIAAVTGKGQIGQVVAAAMLLRDDMGNGIESKRGMLLP